MPMRSASLFISSGDPLLDRRFEWADGLLARGEADAAAKLLEETLARAPGFVAGWFLLAGAREQAGDRGGAIEAYRRTLALDPADRLGTALRLARLGEGDGLGAMTGAYVRTLFDQYAPRFDRELRDALHYRGPDLLRAGIVVFTACSILDAAPASWARRSANERTSSSGSIFRPRCSPSPNEKRFTTRSMPAI